MTNLNEWEPRAWWVLRNPLDDLADAAQQLAYQWRHFRDWERLMADDLEAARSERAQGLLQWHRERIADAIGRLRGAQARANLRPERRSPLEPLMPLAEMAERYTPWPPMQTREEAAAKPEGETP